MNTRQKGNDEMLEKDIEKALVREVKNRRGVAFKFVSPGMAGVPDRIVILPGSIIAFIELKKPGEQLRPLQEKRASQLEALGFSVFCIDSKDQIKEVLDEIQSA